LRRRVFFDAGELCISVVLEVDRGWEEEILSLVVVEAM
jgi:hypothetical protein